jgi:aconitate hydratase
MVSPTSITSSTTLPFSLRVLLENLLRNEDGGFVKKADVEALAAGT